MLVEEGASKRKPDWFGISWYGFLAAYCIYEIATGAKELAYLVAGPLYFSIVIFCSFFAFALIIGILSQLLAFITRRKVFGVEPLPVTKKTLESFFILPLMGLSLIAVALYFYDKMDRDYVGELGGLSVQAVFAMTFLQPAIASIPRRQEGSGWRGFAEKWLRGALSSIFIPSFVGVIAILAGSFALTLLLGTGDLEAQVYRFLFYFFAIFLTSYRHFLEKAGKNLRNGIERREWVNKVICLVLGSLAAAAALHLPITYLAEAMGKTQKFLVIFFFAYLFLAYAQTFPKWYVEMLEEKKGAKAKTAA